MHEEDDIFIEALFESNNSIILMFIGFKLEKFIEMKYDQ